MFEKSTELVYLVDMLKFKEFLLQPLIIIFLGIIFFGIITPLGLVFKLFRMDVLGLKFNNNNSYWNIRKKTKIKMDKQF